MGGGSKCYTPTPEVTIFVTILLLCILSFRQTLLYISQQKGQSVFLLNQHQRVMTGLVSDGHTIERYHKKYFAQTNNLTIARNVNKENRLCLVIYNPDARHRRSRECGSTWCHNRILVFLCKDKLGLLPTTDCQQNSHVQKVPWPCALGRSEKY